MLNKLGNRLMLKIICAIGLLVLLAISPIAQAGSKIMVLDFQLNDLTDLPNAPEELARIAQLSSTFKQSLADGGVALIVVNDALKAALSAQSATYLFEHPEAAAKLAQGSGAEYLILGVALKPTYLFVYPRILLVDIKKQQVIFASYVQLESSWSDNNTTARSAQNLADKLIDKLKQLNPEN